MFTISRTTYWLEAIVIVSLCAWSSQASACANDKWFLYPPGACAGTSVTPIEAGGYGTFFFADQEPAGCSAEPLATGTISDGIALYAPPGPPPPGNWPCQGGSCLTDIDNVSGEWTLIIDFPDTWHQDTVAATALVASGAGHDVAAIPFPNVPTLGCGGHTDVDFLISLAKLVEKVDSDPASAPATINLSFGRLPSNGEPTDASCDESEISCQVSRLLAHLKQDDPDGTGPRTALIAAYGNEKTEFFPASLDHVESVAVLDLGAYLNRDENWASWETRGVLDDSKPASAFMPGAAICLEYQGQTFTPPAGSSYASTFFSGALTAALAENAELVRQHLVLPGAWTLNRLCTAPGCDYELQHAGITIDTIGPTAANLMDDVLYSDLSTCGPTTAPGLALLLTMFPVAGDPLEGIDSLGEYAINNLKAAPQSDPCTPCTMSCQMGGGVVRGDSVFAGPSRRPRKPAFPLTALLSGRVQPSFPASSIEVSTPTPKESRTDLESEAEIAPAPLSSEWSRKLSSSMLPVAGTQKVKPDGNPVIPVVVFLDTHESWALDDDMQVRIKKAYMRFDFDYHEVILSPGELEALSQGKIAHLEISGALTQAETELQPSWVTVIEVLDPVLGPKTYWKSVPAVTRDLASTLP